MTDWNKLIPEMRDWNDGAGIDVESWIGCEGNFRLAVGYSSIFWPQFVEFEGYVLREPFSIDSLRSFEKRSGRDRRSVEAVMNHLHIVDLQHAHCEDKTRERIVHLGHVLRSIYEIKLTYEFPDRRFEVPFDDSYHEDLTDYQVTFFQAT